MRNGDLGRSATFFCPFLKDTSYLSKSQTPVMKYLKEIEITEPFSGVESIDCIYLINLDQRIEKLERVQKNLDDQGIKFNRLAAVEGHQFSEEELQELAGPYPVRMKKGHTGCALSHISIIKYAERKLDRIWIFEDDVEFLESSKQIPELLKQLTKIDPEWDVFYTDKDLNFLDSNELLVPKRHNVIARENQSIRTRKYYLKRFAKEGGFTQVRFRWGLKQFSLNLFKITYILSL